MNVLLLLLGTSLAADTLDIRTANDQPDEHATAQLLQDLVRDLDLRDWVRTRDVVIDRTQIPHSHPVLTLHTRHLEEPDQLLSTFLHEQFHWWVGERREALEAAKEAFRKLWPEVPAAADGGARDEDSTYLHLVVCDLELQATALLLGEEAAREALARYTHYGWIYERVLEDPRVRDVMAAHGLILE